MNVAPEQFISGGKFMKCDTIPDLEGFLKIQEQALAANSDEVATTASKLAELYIQSNRLENAEVVLKRALRITQKLQLMNADCKRSIDECQSALNKVVTMREERLRPDATSTTMLNPVKVPTGVSHPGATRSKSSDLLVIDNPKSLSNLPSPQQVQTKTENFQAPSDGEYGIQNNQVLLSAVRKTERELAVMREIIGCDHPSVADTLRKLADLYYRLRMLGKMEPVLLESLRIRERVFGVDHLCVATELKNLAMLYLCLERFNEAEPLLKRAIVIRQKNLGLNHAEVTDLEELYAALLSKASCFIQTETAGKHICKVSSMTNSEAGIGVLPNSFR